jgi:TDG/mug DNA glycosylase family protein
VFVTGPLLQGLPPIASPASRVLILGSMPGAASLAAGQYYAHPRNRFWPLLGDLLGFDPALPYAARVRALKSAGIALWDVIGACHRPGSLDARIDPRSIVVNDFAAFFACHRQLTTVCFNGATAAASFRRLALPTVATRALDYHSLPSTSPANASIPDARKRAAWAVIAAALAGGQAAPDI